MERLERVYRRLVDWMDGPGNRLSYGTRTDLWDALGAVRRLLDGELTKEEFQNLCHNLTTDDKEKFREGCKEYQEKLFGKGEKSEN